ncbi:MAG: iron-containing alcohol dehydrogenase [bacterium]|nr:iron-containing alcohol dehydrogenase [bacterium]
MSAHEFFVPAGIFYGAGALGRLGGEAAALGRRALLVSGRGALERAGLLGEIAKALRGAGVETVPFPGVEPDPSIETVDAGGRAAVDGRCDLVVAAGGGSALDAGKAIAAMATNPGSVRDFLEGRELSERPLPFIAVPTTAGTGSEATRNAVITNRQAGSKRSIRHRMLVPRVAIVDPALTLPLPPDITAFTGMDALAQLLEPYVSRRCTPLTDALALDGMALVGRSLARAVANGGDIGARADMSLASLLGGMALANAGLGAAHALSHPLGARFGIPHGRACAILLPHVMAFNLPAAREKYGRAAAALGADTAGLSPDDAARAAVERVRRLAEGIGITGGLSRFGVRDGDLPGIAREARGSSLDANPIAAAERDLTALLEKAL